MSLKHNDVENIVMSEYLFSVENMVRYIKKLKQVATPGYDGVSSEHLKFAINTSLPQYLSDILTVCFRYGVLQRSFYCGILVPLLQKQHRSFNPKALSTHGCFNCILNNNGTGYNGR